MSPALRLLAIGALVALPAVARASRTRPPAQTSPAPAPSASTAAAATNVTEVAPGVFFAQTATEPQFLGSNSGFVVLADEVLVVDASFPAVARALLDEVARHTDRPVRLVFDTHWHPDHAFGNGVFAQRGAALVAQQRCVEDERGRGAAAFAEQSRSTDAAQRAVVDGTAFRAATVSFDERLDVGDGKRRVELLHFGRGHTRGDAVAWLPDERVLFTGDLCVNGPLDYVGEGDVDHWLTILDRLIALRPKVVCPGHGAAGGPDLLEKQKRWFVELRAAADAAIAGGRDADALVASLEMPWYRDLTGVEAKSRGDLVRHVYDERCGRAPPLALLDELGLKVDAGPNDPSPGGARPRDVRPRDAKEWRAPRKVVVVGEPNALRAATLRLVAPDVELAFAKDRAAARSLVADADGLVGACSAELLEAGTKLRWVQVGSAGVEEYVALPRVASREVALTNAQRLYGPEIADHAMGLLLALTRQLTRATPSRAELVELRDRTVLVAGLGGIGREIAKRAASFGARVVATEGHPKEPPPFVERVGGPDALFDFAREADVVFVCTPLTRQTERMFDARFFGVLKPGAFLVNVARGRCVDSDALFAALESGRLRGAGLDVTDPEPLPLDHPLRKLANVIVTPHDAAASDAASERQFLLFRENLRRFAAGEPLLSVVDPAAGY
jgi:phosphoglycerate dehydrogenase-like enzyme/glyoxylase-like metal-dependent hydrolase (beta-lactamase superfamily II)